MCCCKSEVALINLIFRLGKGQMIYVLMRKTLELKVGVLSLSQVYVFVCP